MVTKVNYSTARKSYIDPEIFEIQIEDTLILCASIGVPDLTEEPAPFEWQ